MTKKCTKLENWYTPGPLLSSHPPRIKRSFSKVPNFCAFKCFIRNLYLTASSIKRPRPPAAVCCCKFIIYCFFYSTSITRSANCLFKKNGGRAHRRSTLTVCSVSRLPEPYPIYLKGKRRFRVVTTPRLTTANISECAFYIFACVHLHM